MPEYDFFELTGVSLEEEKAPNVKAAIARKEKELGEALSTSDQNKRREADAQLKFLRAKRDELFGPKAKFKAVFAGMVKARIAELKKRLDARVKIEADARSVRVVTKGKLKSIRNNKAVSGGLPLKDIEDVYRSNGFTIEEHSPLRHAPKFPANIESIYKDLEELRARVRKDMAVNPKRQSADNVQSLYSFAAYISGGTLNAQTCEKCPAAKLKAICEDYQKKHTNYQSETIEKLAANIAGQAASHVFDTEEHRHGYNQYILYMTPALQRLFNEYIKGLSEADKRDPEIAGYCIKKITAVFGDYDTALALYNIEARMQNDPYEPQNPVFAVKCPHCQAVCEFPSPQEARKINSCTNCGEKLYKQCPKGHYVLLDAAKCPDCGYSFPDEAAFAKFFALAESALRRKDFTTARNMLSSAIEANPLEVKKIQELDRLIAAAEHEHNKAIDELNALIRQLRFSEALTVADALAVSRPDVDISSQRTIIMRVLTECGIKFTSASSQSAKVNACLDILTKCVDFKPAADFLAHTSPQPCALLSASVDDENTAVSLVWKPSTERDVKYILIRKKDSAPINPNDGNILLNRSKELSYTDNNIEAGVNYIYSVFVQRSGLYSQPASASVIVFSTVSGVGHTQSGNTLHIFWTPPKNCLGVRVMSQTASTQTLLSASAMNSITVDSIEFGKRYSFLLTASYSGGGNSRTVRYDVTPTPEIRPFTISAARVTDNLYSLSWSITEAGTVIQIFSGDEVIGSGRSEMRSCQIKLKPDRYYVIRAGVSSGGKVMYSTNSVDISTFSSCTVDDSKTSVTEEVTFAGYGKFIDIVHISLALSVKNQKALKKLVYFVRTDGTWASERDVLSQASTFQTINTDALQKNSVINIDLNAVDEESYNITLFAVYEAGCRDIVSAPCRKSVSRPLNANVFCSVSRPLFRNIKLHFRGEANRPVRRWPGFVVCISSDGRPILNYTDNNAVTILKVEPVTQQVPSSYLEQTFEIARKLPKGQHLYLFWADLKPGENFVFRWDSGFNGTV